MPDLYIDGRWTAARSGRFRDIHCPADGSFVARVDEGSAADTRDAIAAARRGFDSGPWPHSSGADRRDLLLRVADLLTRDRDGIARAESADTGKRLIESGYDLDDVIAVFRYFAGLAVQDGRRPVETAQEGKVDEIGPALTEEELDEVESKRRRARAKYRSLIRRK